MCTGHCTVQCPVHRRPRADPIFLCAVRWFTGQLLCAVRCAPDRHCRLSGAPILRFKKKRLQPEAEPEAIRFLPTLWLSALSGDPVTFSVISLAGGDLLVTKLLLGLGSPLVSSHVFPLLSSISVQPSELTSTLCAQFKFFSIFCESKCWMWFLCVPLNPLQVPSSFGRVSQP